MHCPSVCVEVKRQPTGSSFLLPCEFEGSDLAASAFTHWGILLALGQNFKEEFETESLKVKEWQRFGEF